MYQFLRSYFPFSRPNPPFLGNFCQCLAVHRVGAFETINPTVNLVLHSDCQIFLFQLADFLFFFFGKFAGVFLVVGVGKLLELCVEVVITPPSYPVLKPKLWPLELKEGLLLTHCALTINPIESIKIVVKNLFII